MTTPIPDAAVLAALDAAEELGLRHLDSDGAPVYCPNVNQIRTILAAALPLLGDTTTEFGLLRRGDTTPRSYPTLDHAENARRMEAGGDPDGRAELFVRYVSAWKPAVSARGTR